MKLTIIGGSRGTGAALADQAFVAGDDVTIVSRSGNTPSFARTITGSATDPQVIAEAVSDADAVVIAVGGTKDNKFNRRDVTQVVIDAMNKAGVKRLIVHSSLGAGDSEEQMKQPIRWIAMKTLATPLADHDAQEELVKNSGLDWTIVRPSGLRNSPATGEYKALEVGDSGHLGGSISRSDVAAFILQALRKPSTIGKAIGLST